MPTYDNMEKHCAGEPSKPCECGLGIEAPPVVWGAANYDDPGGLVDQLILRCCYGQDAVDNPKQTWHVCGESYIDERNLRLSTRRLGTPRHSHSAECWVLVRVIGTQVSVMHFATVLTVRVKDADMGNPFATPHAPDSLGLWSAIRDWVVETYTPSPADFEAWNNSGGGPVA